MLVLFLIKIAVIIITFEHHRCSDDSGKLILTEVKDGPLLQVDHGDRNDDGLDQSEVDHGDVDHHGDFDHGDSGVHNV